MIDLKTISTEYRNPKTMNIDLLRTIDIVKLINEEDEQVALAVKQALDQIALVIDKVVESFEQGGRLIYVGAGTSGRIGVLDAVECPPTFGVDDQMVMGLIAGGASAFVKAKEGAEDSQTEAIVDLKAIKINAFDFIIGLAASGRTPYVLSAVSYAKSLGAKTSCITTSINSPLAKAVDYPIEAITGPEVLTGSTRMKSATAQKMICNMISTIAMIKMGKVYENLMIDVRATNLKLISRSLKIISDITHYSIDEARLALTKYQSIKNVIFNYLTSIDDINLIEQYLNESKGHLRHAVNLALGK